MSNAGFEILGHAECPIVPVLLRDANVATKLSEALLEEGLYVIAFSYPVVPKGQARIRVQLSAGHSHEQIMAAARAFENAGKRMGILG